MQPVRNDCCLANTSKLERKHAQVRLYSPGELRSVSGSSGVLDRLEVTETSCSVRPMSFAVNARRALGRELRTETGLRVCGTGMTGYRVEEERPPEEGLSSEEKVSRRGWWWSELRWTRVSIYMLRNLADGQNM